MAAEVPTVSPSWLAALRDTLRRGRAAIDAGRAQELADALAPLVQRADCPTAALLDGIDGIRRLRVADADGPHHSCLVIAWPAGAATPLHDHAGLWGVELVLDGALAVEEFAAIDAPPHGALVCRRRLLLGLGDAAAFGGGDYVHRCRNLSPQRAALSLHVYGGVLHRYRVFEPAPPDWSARSATAVVDAELR